MIDVRFRPISTWPRSRTAEYDRVNPAFTVTFNATLDRLEKELKHLKATDVVIESGHDARHIRNDGWPRGSAADPADPGVILSFTSIHGALRLPSDRFRRWQTNLHAIALHLEHLRLSSAWGVGQFGEQYKGWARLEAGAPIAMAPAMTVEEAARFIDANTPPMGRLGMSEIIASPMAYRVAYRTVAKVVHPDSASGDAQSWEKLQRAKAVLDAHHDLTKKAGSA